MNDDALRDLERWERGDLSTAELLARHPDHEPLLRAHRTVTDIASAEIPSSDPSWQRVRASLAGPRSRPLWRVAPAAALGSIALLASMGAVAAATVPVETAQAIDHVLHVVGHHQHGQHPPVEHPPAHTPVPSHAPLLPSHAPSTSPHR